MSARVTAMKTAKTASSDRDDQRLRPVDERGADDVDAAIADDDQRR